MTPPVLRVAIVITKGETGGAQTHVAALCHSLRERVVFTVLIGGDGAQSALGQTLAAQGIRVVSMPELRNTLQPFAVGRAIWSLRRWLHNHPQDVLHAHSAVAGVVARVAGRMARLPVVYTVHGFGFKPQAPTLQRTFSAWAEKVLAPWTAHLICVSRAERELAGRLPLGQEWVTVIHNGLDDVPVRSEAGAEPATVAMVARMAAPKRPDLLVEALALLAQEGLRPPTTLMGDGPLRPAIAGHIEAHGLQHIQLAGEVPDVAQRLAAHQIFVLVSDHEGLPISLLEAMRSGMAIVSSRLPGVQELLDDGREALLVENTPQSIAAALRQLLSDAALRTRMGQAARTRFEVGFDADRMAERVLRVYREVPLLPATGAWRRQPRDASALASRGARRQRAHLAWSVLGLGLIAGAWAISLLLQRWGWATYVFSQTVLASVIPYLVAARLLYQGAHVPAAERLGLMTVTVSLPYLMTPLCFALLQQPYSRGALLLTGVLAGAWFWWAERSFERRRPLRLIALDPAAGVELQRAMGESPVAGLAEVRLSPWPAHWVDAVPGSIVCEGAVVSDPSQVDPKVLTALKLQHIRLYHPESLAELLIGRLAQRKLSDAFWELEGHPGYDLLKRVMDVALVLLFSPVWVPLALLVALGVRLDTAGPVLFSQMRVGLHGRAFRIWKFRSMRHSTVKEAAFAQADDPRVTRWGAFMRRTRLDELPQLVNVLMGHMSLIGPRPEQEAFVREFAAHIPSYTYRHLVRPGLTGWAQVQQGYAASADETVLKLRYDLYYVTHYSLALDLLIFLKTVRTVLTGFGAR